jgi:phosphate transport system protein
MSELQRRTEALLLMLDRMGLRAERAVHEALRAVHDRDIIAGEQVDQDDARLDAEEVEVERECVRLMALYQPTAVDLRTLVFVIKANNDLERIADKAAHIGRRVKHCVAEHVVPQDLAEYADLERLALDVLGRTVRLLSRRDADAARETIALDQRINHAYKKLARRVLEDPEFRGDVDRVLTVFLLARALERIGDLCTNIAEDVVFLCTGDIVRHPDAQASPQMAPPMADG